MQGKMPGKLLVACALALLAAVGGCAANDPRPVAVDPGEPIPRPDAFAQLMAINDMHAGRFGITVAELRRRDIVCVMLATGVEIRPGIVIPYEEAMLSAIRRPEGFLDVRVDTIDPDASVYAAQGCDLLQLVWDEDAEPGSGTFQSEAAAREYLDRIATAWTSLDGTLQRRVRRDDETTGE
ncbi:MAG: hypothetical protein R3270_01520 [Gammaproteobacteria bacterium]|nr:hypothetical protein [Gammaproteobacteria bacterium]